MAVFNSDEKADEVIARLEVIQFNLANDMNFKQTIIEIMRNKDYTQYKDQLRQYLIETLKNRRPNDIARIVHIIDYEIKILDPMAKPLVILPPTPLGEVNHKSKPQQKAIVPVQNHSVKLGLFSKKNLSPTTNQTSLNLTHNAGKPKLE